MPDPLSYQFPHNSIYAFQENKLGQGVELEGAEVIPFPAIPFIFEGATAVGEYLAGTAIGVAAINWMKSKANEPGVGQGIQNSTVQLWVQQRGQQMTNNEIRKVPNPNGKKGGEKHQNTNKKEAERMKSEGKEVEAEVKIPTPDGKKKSRYVDQTGTDPNTGKKEMIQVGKQNKNGTPVKRERDALDDIEKATGERPKFVPYNN